MENKPLEQPFLNNVMQAALEYGQTPHSLISEGASEEILSESANIFAFRDGAQYGFNLRDVFCEELKKLIAANKDYYEKGKIEHEEEKTALRNEIYNLKNQLDNALCLMTNDQLADFNKLKI